MAEPTDESPQGLFGGEFRSHLDELRQRLFRVALATAAGFIAAIALAPQIYLVLAQQVTDLGYLPKLMNLQGGLGLYMKIGLMGAIVTGLPMLVYQLVRFALPGLYPHERRVVVLAMIPITILFLSGTVFSYIVVAPAAFSFFDRINEGFASTLPGEVTEPTAEPEPPEPEPVRITILGLIVIEPVQMTLPEQEPTPEANSGTDPPQQATQQANDMVILEMRGYINLLLLLILGVGLAFQIPVVLIVLARLGIITPQSMAKNRLYYGFGIMVLTFLLTADPLSSIFLGVPLYLMFEASILISKIWLRRLAEADSGDTA